MIIPSDFYRSTEPKRTFQPEKNLTTSLLEFVDDATYYEYAEEAPGWGETEWVFSTALFNEAFEICLKQKDIVAARRSGLIEMHLTEKDDGDDQDTITLIAFERSGAVKFAQKWVFEDMSFFM